MVEDCHGLFNDLLPRTNKFVNLACVTRQLVFPANEAKTQNELIEFTRLKLLFTRESCRFFYHVLMFNGLSTLSAFAADQMLSGSQSGMGDCMGTLLGGVTNNSNLPSGSLFSFFSMAIVN